VNLAYTILFVLPLGLLIRRQSTAILSYMLAGSYLLGFQHTSVMLSGSATRSPRLSAGSPRSSQPSPKTSEAIGYMVINVVTQAIPRPRSCSSAI
jgi:hypothetical protein